MQPVRTIAQWEHDKQRGEKNRAKRLVTARIPSQFHDATWADYEPTAGTSDELLKDILIDYAEHWKPEQRDGLVLLGPPGFGKTMGLCLLGMALNDKGAWVKYIPYAEYVDRHKALIGLEQQAQQTDDWDAWNKATYRLMFIQQECDVLLLDDVGKEYRAASGYSDDLLDRLLRKRVELGKLTFISSNLSVKEFQDYNASMASFIYEVGEVVALQRGRDHRLATTEGQRRRRAIRGAR